MCQSDFISCNIKEWEKCIIHSEYALLTIEIFLVMDESLRGMAQLPHGHQHWQPGNYAAAAQGLKVDSIKRVHLIKDVAFCGFLSLTFLQNLKHAVSKNKTNSSV